MSGSEGEEAKEDNDAKDDDGGSSSASSIGENDATDGEISSSDVETGTHKKKDKKEHKHKKKKKHKDKDKEKSKRKRTHSRFVFYVSCHRTRVNEVVVKKDSLENVEFTLLVYRGKSNISSSRLMGSSFDLLSFENFPRLDLCVALATNNNESRLVNKC